MSLVSTSEPRPQFFCLHYTVRTMELALHSNVLLSSILNRMHLTSTKASEAIRAQWMKYIFERNLQEVLVGQSNTLGLKEESGEQF